MIQIPYLLQLAGVALFCAFLVWLVYPTVFDLICDFKDRIDRDRWED